VVAKPTKRKTPPVTDKVMPTGGPRQPVKRIAPRDGDVAPAEDEVLADDETDEVTDDETDEVTDDATTSDDETTDAPAKKTGTGVTSVKKSSKDAAPSGRTSKRVTAKGTPAASTRYTPPSPNTADLPSPMWVPILMFTLFALGMLSIFLNYLGLLPGATSNWYLLLGLGFILGGIITATQYR
jgi:hypothetical protein